MKKRLPILIAAAMALTTMSGTALANNPPGDPLPANGEPNCLGARVSHSASDHGLTPAEKVSAHEGNIEFLLGLDESLRPSWAPAYLAYFETHGVSVRTVQDWIRINCSDQPIIANP